MIRKVILRTDALHLTASFVAVLTALIAQPALAQMPGQRQPSVKSHALRVANGPSQELQKLDRSDPSVALFLPAVAYTSVGTSYCVVIADVNGDGKMDVVAGGNTIEGGSVGVLLGNGDGTFRAAVSYDSGGRYANSLAVADVNNDGKLDVAVADTNSSVVGILMGNGDGTFQRVATYGSGGTGAESITVADVNRDAKPDLVVTNETGGAGDVVGVLLGNGDGTFKPVVSYSSGGFLPTSVAVSDVNGDGRRDLVVANKCSVNGPCVGEGAVGILLGNGNGTFQSPVAYDSGGILAGAVLVADVDGDGKRDVVVTNCGPSGSGSCSSGNLVSVLLGNGNGTFQSPVTYDSGGVFPTSLAFRDVNRDGKPDLLVANETSAGVLLGNGDGTFQPADTYELLGGFPGLSIAVGDMNGDRRPDLLVADGQIALLLNIGGPATTTTLVSNLNPVAVNETVTYTATVKNGSSGAVTGTVMFKDGERGTPTAAVPVAATESAFSVSYGQPGRHIIVATYLGDRHNAASTSDVALQYVGSGFPTGTALSTSGSPSFVGQPVTFTASVSPLVGMVRDGELVTFYDGNTAVGTGSTTSGVAVLTVSSLTVKTHAMKAIYSGDAVFRESTGKVTQVVEKYPTAATLTTSLNPSQFGQEVTFTVGVTSSGPTPTGKVQFLDGITPLGTVTLSGGVARLSRSKLAVGTHTMKAQYQGNAADAKSTSNVVNQVVQ